MFPTKLISFLCLGCLVKLIASDLPSSKCVITDEELADMDETIVEFFNKDAKRSRKSCDALLSQTVKNADSLKLHLFSKTQECDRIYNETERVLIAKENELKTELENIPKIYQDRYSKEINRISNDMKEFQDLINELTIERNKYLSEIEYYGDILKNRSQFPNRLDDDSYFESANKCTFQRSSVLRLINSFNDIFELIAGKPKSSETDCFEEIRHQMSDIDNIVSFGIQGCLRETKLRDTYDERAKYYQEFIDQYTVVASQSSAKALNSAQSKLQKIKLEYEILKNTTNLLREKSSSEGVKTVKLLIRSGTKFWKSRDLYIKIRKDSPNVYEEILKSVYGCNDKYIEHAVKFVSISGRNSGLEIIGKEMIKCGHTGSPFMLIVAYYTQKPEFQIYVEKIYEAWATQIKLGSTEKIKTLKNVIDDKIVDFPRLFRVALKSAGLTKILEFIDRYHAYYQNVIVDLYDVLLERKDIDTLEHVEISRWISEKMKWVNKQPSNSIITGNLDTILPDLKNRLPSGLQHLFFDPYVILATENFGKLMRSGTHNDVKFRIQVHPHARGYYRFEDIRHGKTFYTEEVTDEETKARKSMVRIGNSNADNSYWQIIPVRGAEFFHLKNKANGKFLSSNEQNVCLRYEKHWMRWSCKAKEYMNDAHESTSDSSIQWMFTENLIRNGLLPDRNQG